MRVRFSVVQVLLLSCTIALLAVEGLAQACPDPKADESWFTGPMLAPSANSLPKGHWLFEPYLFQVRSDSHFDSAGQRRASTASHSFGSLTYILYGLTDRFTVGLIPLANYNLVSGLPSSSGIRMGDMSLHLHYRLTNHTDGNWKPSTAIAFEEKFPIGAYDRLGDNPNNGSGSGTYTSTAAFYSQFIFRGLRRRTLRVRLNTQEAFSSGADVRGTSVYGTSSTFSGTVDPSRSFSFDGSAEQSLTRRWAIASDIYYGHSGNTRLAGTDLNGTGQAISTRLDSGTSSSWYVAPAVEYNLNANVGVLFGVRVSLAGRNSSASITPAIAVNIFR